MTKKRDNLGTRNSSNWLNMKDIKWTMRNTWSLLVPDMLIRGHRLFIRLDGEQCITCLARTHRGFVRHTVSYAVDEQIETSDLTGALNMETSINHHVKHRCAHHDKAYKELVNLEANSRAPLSCASVEIFLRQVELRYCLANEWVISEVLDTCILCLLLHSLGESQRQNSHLSVKVLDFFSMTKLIATRETELLCIPAATFWISNTASIIPMHITREHENEVSFVKHVKLESVPDNPASEVFHFSYGISWKWSLYRRYCLLDGTDGCSLGWMVNNASLVLKELITALYEATSRAPPPCASVEIFLRQVELRYCLANEWVISEVLDMCILCLLPHSLGESQIRNSHLSVEFTEAIVILVEVLVFFSMTKLIATRETELLCIPAATFWISNTASIIQMHITREHENEVSFVKRVKLECVPDNPASEVFHFCYGMSWRWSLYGQYCLLDGTDCCSLVISHTVSYGFDEQIETSDLTGALNMETSINHHVKRGCASRQSIPRACEPGSPISAGGHLSGSSVVRFRGDFFETMEFIEAIVILVEVLVFFSMTKLIATRETELLCIPAATFWISNTASIIQMHITREHENEVSFVKHVKLECVPDNPASEVFHFCYGMSWRWSLYGQYCLLDGTDCKKILSIIPICLLGANCYGQLRQTRLYLGNSSNWLNMKDIKWTMRNTWSLLVPRLFIRLDGEQCITCFERTHHGFVRHTVSYGVDEQIETSDLTGALNMETSINHHVKRGCASRQSIQRACEPGSPISAGESHSRNSHLSGCSLGWMVNNASLVLKELITALYEATSRVPLSCASVEIFLRQVELRYCLANEWVISEVLDMCILCILPHSLGESQIRNSHLSVEFKEAIVILVEVLVFFSMTKLIATRETELLCIPAATFWISNTASIIPMHITREHENEVSFVKHVKLECVPDNPASEVFHFCYGMSWRWSLYGQYCLLDGTDCCSLGWMVNNASLVLKELITAFVDEQIETSDLTGALNMETSINHHVKRGCASRQSIQRACEHGAPISAGGHLSGSSVMRFGGDFLETSRAVILNKPDNCFSHAHDFEFSVLKVEFTEAIVILVEVLVFFSMTKLIATRETELLCIPAATFWISNTASIIPMHITREHEKEVSFVKHVKLECVPNNPASEVFHFSYGMSWKWSLYGRYCLLDGTDGCSLGLMVNNASLVLKELIATLYVSYGVDEQIETSDLTGALNMETSINHHVKRGCASRQSIQRAWEPGAPISAGSHLSGSSVMRFGGDFLETMEFTEANVILVEVLVFFSMTKLIATRETELLCIPAATIWISNTASIIPMHITREQENEVSFVKHVKLECVPDNPASEVFHFSYEMSWKWSLYGRYCLLDGTDGWMVNNASLVLKELIMTFISSVGAHHDKAYRELVNLEATSRASLSCASVEIFLRQVELRYCLANEGVISEVLDTCILCLLPHSLGESQSRNSHLSVKHVKLECVPDNPASEDFHFSYEMSWKWSLYGRYCLLDGTDGNSSNWLNMKDIKWTMRNTWSCWFPDMLICGHSYNAKRVSPSFISHTVSYVVNEQIETSDLTGALNMETSINHHVKRGWASQRSIRLELVNLGLRNGQEATSRASLSCALVEIFLRQVGLRYCLANEWVISEVLDTCILCLLPHSMGESQSRNSHLSGYTETELLCIPAATFWISNTASIIPMHITRDHENEVKHVKWECVPDNRTNEVFHFSCGMSWQWSLYGCYSLLGGTDGCSLGWTVKKHVKCGWASQRSIRLELVNLGLQNGQCEATSRAPPSCTSVEIFLRQVGLRYCLANELHVKKKSCAYQQLPSGSPIRHQLFQCTLHGTTNKLFHLVFIRLDGEECITFFKRTRRGFHVKRGWASQRSIRLELVNLGLRNGQGEATSRAPPSCTSVEIFLRQVGLRYCLANEWVTSEVLDMCILCLLPHSMGESQSLNSHLSGLYPCGIYRGHCHLSGSLGLLFSDKAYCKATRETELLCIPAATFWISNTASIIPMHFLREHEQVVSFVKYVIWECVPDNPASEVFHFSCEMSWQWSLYGSYSLLDGTDGCSLGWTVKNVSLASKELATDFSYTPNEQIEISDLTGALNMESLYKSPCQAWVGFTTKHTVRACKLGSPIWSGGHLSGSFELRFSGDFLETSRVVILFSKSVCDFRSFGYVYLVSSTAFLEGITKAAFGSFSDRKHKIGEYLQA
ncbi:hypothetical protein SESBI_11891 [Sesbania bispinosa]|nr:hypothetical protein SESBI_11891 [Sesbania bispinosa]